MQSTPFVDPRVMLELMGGGGGGGGGLLTEDETLKRRMKKGHLPEERWNERWRQTPKL